MNKTTLMVSQGMAETEYVLSPPWQQSAQVSDHQLLIETAGISIAGGKLPNEDAICLTPELTAHAQIYKGFALALADGVSSAEAGASASQYACASFVADYYKTPDSWSTDHSAATVLTSINSTLYQRSHQYQQDDRGHLCTFTGLVLKSATARWFHIGDSRLYLLRAGKLRQISTDHTTKLSENRQFLGRALGMDEQVQWQHGSVPLEAGDLFLLCSDGLSDFVSDAEITGILLATQSLQQQVEALLQAAQHSDDNISVVLAKVRQLPAESLDDYNERLTRLPFLPALDAGMKVDGYEVQRPLFASARSHLYLVRDLANNTELVLKTPSQNFADDSAYIERFIREEWVGLRIDHPAVVRVIRQQRRRTFLYYLMEYLPGDSLDCYLATQAQPMRPSVAIAVLRQIAEALGAFHQLGIIHQDLKPANIMRLSDGQLKIVDFGSAYVPGLAELYSPLTQELALGTASYSDPHYLHGHNSGEQGDVYALATIAYELFTGNLPYGDKVEDCSSLADYQRLRYQSARNHNSRIPLWFDRALQKGVSFDLSERYLHINQLMQDLQQPNPLFLHQQVSLAQKNNKLLFWQLMSGFWFITFILLFWLFSLRG
jgi:protein phosphatase